MGFRFQRRIRILPALRINVGKSGVSSSVGTRGAWFTIGPRGTRTTVGIPGTGFSYTDRPAPADSTPLASPDAELTQGGVEPGATRLQSGAGAMGTRISLALITIILLAAALILIVG
jgi:hypothetical protein